MHKGFRKLADIQVREEQLRRELVRQLTKHGTICDRAREPLLRADDSISVRRAPQAREDAGAVVSLLPLTAFLEIQRITCIRCGRSARLLPYPEKGSLVCSRCTPKWQRGYLIEMTRQMRKKMLADKPPSFAGIQVAGCLIIATVITFLIACPN